MGRTDYLFEYKSFQISSALTFVTLEHKTSHKGTFFDIEIYTSSES